MRNFLVPTVGFAVVATLATVLIWAIVLRSPDTHAHLWETWRPEYTRTSPIFVGQEVGGVELTLGQGHLRKGYLAFGEVGRAIYLDLGCATCHGLDAKGGPVGPSLAHSSPNITKRMVREGPGGMPVYGEAVVSEADLGKLATYLQNLKTVKPSTEEIASIQRITYDPSVPTDMLLKGKVAIRRSCGACHTQPTKEEILHAFGNDTLATGLVADMVQETNLSLEDARAIAYYMLAIINGADPIKEP